MPRLDRLWYEIDAETKGFDNGILQSEQRLKSFAEYAAGHPVAVLGALGVAATLAGYKLAQMAASFEHEMTKVSTVLDGADLSVEELSAAVLELNASLPIENVKELTKGLYDVVASGIPAANAVNFLNAAAKAAVGGVTQVSTAVDGLTTAVNAFRTQGLTVERASDVMFQTVLKGKVTFGELSQSMALGASIAASMGIKFEDLNAAVAQLSLGGMDARMAMVGIRSAIVNILKPSEEFQRTFPHIAAEFNRAKLEARGFTGFLTDLVAASKGNSEVFTKLFMDVQGFNAVMALTTDGGKAMNEMLKSVENSAGAADEAARKMGSTTLATNQILKNQFHNELVSLGQDVLPAYNAVLEAAVFWMERMGSAASKTRLKEVMTDLRLLGMQGGEKIEFTNRLGLQSWAGGAALANIQEFIKQVTESRDVLKGFTNEELRQAQAGMRQYGESFPDLKGFDATLREIDALIDERVKADEDARAKQLTADRAITAGAVAMAQSNAKSVAELVKNVDALERGEQAATTYAISIKKLAEANKEAQAAIEAAEAAHKMGNKAAAEAAQKDAGEALGKATAARMEARQALREMEDARRAKENRERQERDRAEAAAKARRDLGFALDEALTKTTATAVDDLAVALSKQVAEFRAKLAETQGLSPEDRGAKSKQIDEIERANERAIALLKTTEKVNAVLNEVDKATLGLLSDTANADLFRTIDAQVKELTDSLRDMDSSSAEFKSKSQDILRLEQARAKLLQYFMGIADKAVSAAEKEAAAKERARRAQERMARDIMQLAKGAMDAAQAFGMMSDSTADALNNVMNIAANLPGALSGDLGSIGAIIGSAGKLLGGLIRSGEAEQEDPQVVKARIENTEALKELTRRIGDLAGSSITGEMISAAKAAIQAITNPGPGKASLRPDTRISDLSESAWKLLNSSFAKAGTNWKEIQELASQLGITLNTVGDLTKLLEAINAADLSAYVDTYAGALQRLNDEFEVFNVTDPAERLRRTIAFLSSAKGIPGIANALKGIDTSTAAGASQAIAALQKFWEELASGNIDVSALGGATLDEALAAVMSLIEQLRGGGSGGSSKSFGYNATITEVTGSHIAGLLGTANVFAQRTMAATEAMAELLRMSSGNLGSLWPPQFSSGTHAIEITLHVHVNGDPSGNTGRIGREIGRAALDEINTGLAGRLRERRRALGNAIVES